MGENWTLKKWVLRMGARAWVNYLGVLIFCVLMVQPFAPQAMAQTHIRSQLQFLDDEQAAPTPSQENQDESQELKARAQEAIRAALDHLVGLIEGGLAAHRAQETASETAQGAQEAAQETASEAEQGVQEAAQETPLSESGEAPVILPQEAAPQTHPETGPETGPEIGPETRPETRIAEQGFTSPPAKIADVAWMIGGWEGAGIEGAQAYEHWLPPSGSGTMVGTFVQEQGDGTILFTEHMYLMEENGSLVVKLKHFGPDLKSWEEKDDMVSFRLIAVEPCAVYFSALTYRCVDKDAGSKSGMVVAVRMQSEGAEINELSFRFEQQRGIARAAAGSDADCIDHTTRGYEKCFANRGKAISLEHERYLAAARAKYSDFADVLEEITASEAAFDAYSQAECSAVYTTFGNGTIRNAEWILCRNDMLGRRTHTIWRNFLTHADNSPPVLPEPKPNR